MCPACILTIGGGLLIAKKLGVNDIFAVGIFTFILSFIFDIVSRKLNHGKVFFPYQRILVTVLILLLIIIIFRALKQITLLY